MQVTLVESFQLNRPFDEVAAIIRDVMGWLAREGIPALRSMNFFADDNDPSRMGALIVFADADHFMEHAAMVVRHPRFREFAAAIRLLEMRVFGPLSAEAETWIRQFDGPIVKLERHVAGFTR